MSTLPLVLVGVPTYLRNDLLDTCLASLAAQAAHPGCGIIVLVVDNDAGEAAETTVRGWVTKFPVPLVYAVEARKGISQARNKIIDHALALDADFICFIDDDETAAPDWLHNLFEAISTTGAGAVQGPVRYNPLACDDSWLQDQPSRHRAELSPIKTPYTNNVIFRASLCREQGLRFDERFSLTGGGDYDFFLRSHLVGNIHLWTNRAIVSEDIPCARQRLNYILRRQFRTAAGHAMSDCSRRGLAAVPAHFLRAMRRSLRGILMLLMTPFALLGIMKFRPHVYRTCNNVAMGLGGLSGLLRLNIKMYQ